MTQHLLGVHFVLGLRRRPGAAVTVRQRAERDGHIAQMLFARRYFKRTFTRHMNHWWITQRRAEGSGAYVLHSVRHRP